MSIMIDKISESNNTSDASLTSIIEYGTTNNSSYHLLIQISALDASTLISGSWLISASVKNIAGTVTLLNTTVVSEHKDTLASTWGVTIDIVSTDIRIRVNGALSQEVQWGLCGTILCNSV